MVKNDNQDQQQPSWLSRTVSAAIAWALGLRFVRALLLFSEKRASTLADGITYRALFSIFAAVLLGFSVAGLWLAGNPAAWQVLVETVSYAIPGLLGEDGLVDPNTINAPISFSVTGIISLVALIGAANGAVASMRTALRRIADTEADDLAFPWVLLRDLALAVGIAIAFALSAGLTFAARLGMREFEQWTGWAGVWWSGQAVSLLIVLALNVALVAGVIVVISGMKPSARALWTGSLMGGLGLLALQELSSLFVGGASNNPLLASFASLIALLLWVNFSILVVLYAACYICTSIEDEADRALSRHTVRNFAERRVRRAEKAVAIATAELRAAQDAAKN
jgi:membrane protein